MDLFLPTLNQMAFLLLLIVIGYILTRLRVVPDNAPGVLSKMENNVFIPALVMGTFMGKFTLESFGTAGKFLLAGFVVIGITAPLAVLLARLCNKDSYIRKIYTYGLAFSNFGFMGNAVVEALFPEIFMEYLIFVLPFWMLIYVWGVPALLIPSDGERKSLGQRMKSFLNPMFISMLIGMVIGLLSPWLTLPKFFTSAVSTLGNCMSPVAMILTGMTIAKIDLKKTFQNWNIYLVSIIRLAAIPAVAIVLLMLLPLDYSLSVCILCSLAMPLGLNTIVVPAGYGQDTTVASGMALISHLLSCISIPLIFMLFRVVVGG